MRTDKKSKMSLEEFRSVFLKLGFILSLLIVFAAFEWSTSEVNYKNFPSEMIVDLDEDIAKVIIEEKILEKPKPKPNQFVELFITDDNYEPDEEMDIIDAEVDQDTYIPMVEAIIEIEEDLPFIFAEQMPEFPGGIQALGKFLQRNIKYPEQAREIGIEGKVFVRFVISADGNVKKVEIVRGVDVLLDEEAIRVVKQMPRWKPGSNRGKNVPVWFTLPINFRLD